ncbi:unannotated protein [freshwater metagenome]|uniref:Unannotated protein n=1 Tax=freshwater metagenome TaxID=449393 RepID=A0A6J7EQQ2_9ZZZZ
MGQNQRLAKHEEQVRCQGCLVALGVFSKSRLDQFEVPVTQLAVNKVIEREGRVRHVERLNPSADVNPGSFQPGENPAVLNGLWAWLGDGSFWDQAQSESHGVPELVGQLLALQNLLG